MCSSTQAMSSSSSNGFARCPAAQISSAQRSALSAAVITMIVGGRLGAIDDEPGVADHTDRPLEVVWAGRAMARRRIHDKKCAHRSDICNRMA